MMNYFANEIIFLVTEGHEPENIIEMSGPKGQILYLRSKLAKIF